MPDNEVRLLQDRRATAPTIQLGSAPSPDFGPRARRVATALRQDEIGLSNIAEATLRWIP